MESPPLPLCTINLTLTDVSHTHILSPGMRNESIDVSMNSRGQFNALRCIAKSFGSPFSLWYNSRAFVLSPHILSPASKRDNSNALHNFHFRSLHLYDAPRCTFHSQIKETHSLCAVRTAFKMLNQSRRLNAHTIACQTSKKEWIEVNNECLLFSIQVKLPLPWIHEMHGSINFYSIFVSNRPQLAVSGESLALCMHRIEKRWFHSRKE